MSERKPSFVPINELTSPRMRVVLPLPHFVDQGQILVNERAIDRLCGIAGIRHLRIIASDHGETSGFVPTIVGFDADGGAYAGKTGLKTSVPVYSSQQETESNKFWYERQANTIISVNIDEMAKRISEEVRWKDGVQSPQPWAYYLNRAMKGGILETGLKNLLNITPRDILILGVAHGTLSTRLLSPEPILNLLASYGIFVSGINVWKFLSNKSLSENRRLSLIYGPQLDRALLFGIYLATQTLVKASKT